MTTDPHHYAIGAMFVTDIAQHIPGLYVSVAPDAVQVQAQPSLEFAEQIQALTAIADLLGAQVVVKEPRTTTNYASNYSYRAHEFTAKYEGVTIHGFVHEAVAAPVPA